MYPPTGLKRARTKWSILSLDISAQVMGNGMNEVLKPINVHMYLTPLCNLACSHCYYDAKRVGDDTGRLLSAADAISIISWLCRRFDADLHLEGGEIFLRPDLDEILAALSPDSLTSLTVTTSGTVPMRVHPERLRALGNLRISIEGHTNELQQTLRPVDLERIFRTTEKLRADEIPFSLRVTLHHSNANKIQEMMPALVERGVERISFFEFQPVGRGMAQMGQHSLTDEDFESILDTLANDGPGAGIRQLKLCLSPRRTAMARKRQSRLESQGFQFVDLSGTPNLTINSNGDLGISPWLATAQRLHDRFANLFETDFRRAIEGRIASGAKAAPCQYTSELLLRYVS